MPSISDSDSYPALCHEVGLDCGSCVTATARESAKICTGLQGKAIGLMFVLLYPNQACAGMHQRFAEEYRKAPGDLNVDRADRRRPMGRVKDKGCAAVA